MSRDDQPHGPAGLFAVSGRAILLAIVFGLAGAALVAAMALSHNPQEMFQGPEGISWIALLPLSLITFVLGSGSVLTLYFALNLLRSLMGRSGEAPD